MPKAGKDVAASRPRQHPMQMPKSYAHIHSNNTALPWRVYAGAAVLALTHHAPGRHDDNTRRTGELPSRRRRERISIGRLT